MVPTHTPLLQASTLVHLFPSSQVAPVSAVGAEQRPVEGLQVPAVMQTPPVQVLGFDPTQAPLWQVSVWVHMLPSLQTVPLAMGAHAPVAELHALHVPHAVPASCQAPLALQSWGWLPLQVFAPGVQTPPQVPLVVLHTFVQAGPLFVKVPVASQS